MTSIIQHSTTPFAILLTERDFDALRHSFLGRLVASDVPMSDWEQKFVNSMCGHMDFTDRQRFVVDNLVKRYSPQLPMPPAVRPRRPRPARISPARAGELFAAARKEMARG